MAHFGSPEAIHHQLNRATSESLKAWRSSIPVGAREDLVPNLHVKNQYVWGFLGRLVVGAASNIGGAVIRAGVSTAATRAVIAAVKPKTVLGRATIGFLVNQQVEDLWSHLVAECRPDLADLPMKWVNRVVKSAGLLGVASVGSAIGVGYLSVSSTRRAVNMIGVAKWRWEYERQLEDGEVPNG